MILFLDPRMLYPKAYNAHYSDVTFDEANSRCEGQGGKLADFHENQNLSAFISSARLPAFGHYWIHGRVYQYCFHSAFPL